MYRGLTPYGDLLGSAVSKPPKYELREADTRLCLQRISPPPMSSVLQRWITPQKLA